MLLSTLFLPHIHLYPGFLRNYGERGDLSISVLFIIELSIVRFIFSIKILLLFQIFIFYLLSVVLDFGFLIENISFIIIFLNIRLMQIECISNLMLHSPDVEDFKQDIAPIFINAMGDDDIRVRIGVTRYLYIKIYI